VVKKLATPELYSLEGVLSLKDDGCLDHDASYQRSDLSSPVTLPHGDACLTVSADGEASFPHTEKVGEGVALPVSLSGWSLGNRDVILMATDTATAIDVWPSLVLLVREGADIGPGALAGAYAFGGLEAANDTGYARVEGEISYDGTGGVSAYRVVRPSGTDTGGGGQDVYAVASTNGAVGVLPGTYTHDVLVGTTHDRRLGQVAPRITTSAGAISPIVVHLPVTSTMKLVPGIEIGIRNP